MLITKKFSLCYVEVGVGVDDFWFLIFKILKFKNEKGCGSKLPIPCRMYIVQLPLYGLHHTGSIMRIPWCELHRANSVVRIPSCAFHRTGTIVRIPFYRASSIVRVPSYEFYRADSIICIPFCAFPIACIPHCVHSLMCIPYCVHSIVCILLYAFLHRAIDGGRKR